MKDEGKRMKVEEEFKDVLMNIELGITDIFKNYPDMLDHDVDLVINNLIRSLQAEKKGRTPKLPTLNEMRQVLSDRLESIIMLMLGRDYLQDDEGNAIEFPRQISLDEMILCLKRIRKSIKMWTKQHGRIGYLSFISSFMSPLDE